jgi:hypothetical protein
MWLRENRSLFKYHVFEPVILEIEIVDSKYAAMIESVIPWKVQRVRYFLILGFCFRGSERLQTLQAASHGGAKIASQYFMW